MTLCAECQLAERDPLHALYGAAPCCRARMVMGVPDTHRRAWCEAIKANASADEWGAIRERLDVLIARERAAKGYSSPASVTAGGGMGEGSGVVQ